MNPTPTFRERAQAALPNKLRTEQNIFIIEKINDLQLGSDFVEVTTVFFMDELCKSAIFDGMERREIARKVAKLIKIKFIKFDGHYEDTVRISAKLSRRLTRRLPRDIAPSNQKPLSLCAFPRFWSLFPIILPRSVRIRVYDPAHQELLEDYLLDRKRFRTKRAKRWVTFSYTLKTAVMVGQSLNAWLGDGARKALKWIGIAFLGNEGLKGLRGLLYELMRRM